LLRVSARTCFLRFLFDIRVYPRSSTVEKNSKFPVQTVPDFRLNQMKARFVTAAF